MTGRQKFAVLGAPTLALLLGTAVWNLWDRREQLLDRAIRIIDIARD